MITTDGKRLMNNVLANRDTQIGTHIALGINIVGDASIDGSVYPTTHNRYHSPYIVDEIPIINAGLIDGDPDQLVFTGQATASKRFIANNIALLALRSALEGNGQNVIVSVASTNWIQANITVPSNIRNFTEDGYILLNATTPREYNNLVSLYSSTLYDIVAFPFTVHGITDPTGVAVTLKFTYKDAVGTIYASQITKTVTTGPNGYKLTGDSDYNSIPTDALVDIENNPRPFLLQARLVEFKDPVTSVANGPTLVANGGRITGVTISVAGSGSGTIACGSIKLTPESVNNFYRITTGFRNLNKTLYKTAAEAYVSAEYRILGVG